MSMTGREFVYYTDIDEPKQALLLKHFSSGARFDLADRASIRPRGVGALVRTDSGKYRICELKFHSAADGGLAHATVELVPVPRPLWKRTDLEINLASQEDVSSKIEATRHAIQRLVARVGAAADHQRGRNLARKPDGVCACGAAKIGAPGHSDWCPLYTPTDPTDTEGSE